MQAVVDFARRHPFAVVGAVVLVALLVAGLWVSDPPTSDDRDRPRPQPTETIVTPGPTPAVPSPQPTRTTPGPGPTTPGPRPSGSTSGPDLTFTPGPVDPSELAVAPHP